jgi:hypothetical protein
MFAITAPAAGRLPLSFKNGRNKPAVNSAVALRNTLTTVDMEASFAWSFAVLSALGICMYTYITGMLVTMSNVTLAGTVAITVTTALIGRRNVTTLHDAKRLRNILTLGNLLGTLSFGGSMVLLGIQAYGWVFLSLL